MEEGEGGTSRERRHICTIMCKLASQWEAAAGHRELNLVLCGNQEGWEGGAWGGGSGGRGRMCTCGSFALFYGAGQHNIVKQLQ